MASEAEKAMSCLLDENILRTIKQKNENNIPLSAAEINAINNRLKTDGVAEAPVVGSTTSQIIEALREQGFKPKLVGTMPEIDTEGDDAATA